MRDRTEESERRMECVFTGIATGMALRSSYVIVPEVFPLLSNNLGRRRYWKVQFLRNGDAQRGRFSMLLPRNGRTWYSTQQTNDSQRTRFVLAVLKCKYTSGDAVAVPLPNTIPSRSAFKFQKLFARDARSESHLSPRNEPLVASSLYPQSPALEAPITFPSRFKLLLTLSLN